MTTDNNGPHDAGVQRTQSIYTWLESQGTEGSLVLAEINRLRARVAELEGVMFWIGAAVGFVVGVLFCAIVLAAFMGGPK